MSLYAWWSQKQFLIAGSCVYTRADGQPVECTQVTIDERHQTSWDDIVCLGMVEDFVSSDKFELYDWDSDGYLDCDDIDDGWEDSNQND